MSECPFCGTKIKDEQRGCQNCGYGQTKDYTQNETIDGSGKEVASQTIFEQTEEESTKQNTGSKWSYDWNNNDLPKFVKALFFLLIFYSPYMGFLSGIVFLFVQNGKHRRFGIRLLLATVIIYILFFVIRLLFFSATLGLGAFTLVRSF